jgi:hypothetical protein
MNKKIKIIEIDKSGNQVSVTTDPVPKKKLEQDYSLSEIENMIIQKQKELKKK